MKTPAFLPAAALAAAVMLCTGCGSDDPEMELPKTPAAAAERIEEVFAEEQPVVRDTATAAREAVRVGDYEKAVVALQALKQRPAPNLEQGLAVHGYMVALEAELINASAAGDERAKRAYELLRKMKRN
jgi:hypothetical protein